MRVEILIVDDDAAIRQTLRILFEEEGLCVHEAADGLAGLAVLRASDRPLVVMLDQVMPRLDGLGMIERIANDPTLARRHAYILSTGAAHPIPAAMQTLLDRLGVVVVPKPYDIEDLMAEVVAGARRVDAPEMPDVADVVRSTPRHGTAAT